MVEKYDKLYESLRNAVKTFPVAILKEDIFKQAEALGIKVEPSEERSLLDGIQRYFRKFKIIATETDILAGSRKGKPVISFKKMSEGEKKYTQYFDVYKSLGQILNEYISKYDEYVIDVNDIITYANKIMPKDITPRPTHIKGESFIKGLKQYLSDRADLYLPPETKRGGIEMEFKPLISITKGEKIGNLAVFREIR